MTEMFDPRKPATAIDHSTTLVMVLELSGKSWEMGASVPGVSRRPLRKIDVRDISTVSKLIEQWKGEASKAGHTVSRVVLGYEAGRDGFWIARVLREHGVEVYVMHPASIAVERRGRRAKTDRIDVDLLLRTLLSWLRGDPRACTMAPIPSEAEEDMREPGREREALVAIRLKIENQIESLLIRFGIDDFRPRLKKAVQKLEALRTFDDRPLPPKTLEKLRRLMVQHRLVSDQMIEIEAARQQVMTIVDPDRIERMIQLLVRLVGLGVETATALVHEVFSRQFRDRKALAAFVGLAGTPFNSGGSPREQGISKNGNPRIRRIITQLMWRWIRFQPDSALALRRERRGPRRRPSGCGVSRQICARQERHEEPGERSMMLTPDTVQGGQDAVPDCGCKMPPSRLVLPPWFPNWPLTNRALWSGTSRSAGYEFAGLGWSEQRGTALEWNQQRPIHLATEKAIARPDRTCTASLGGSLPMVTERFYP